VRKRYGKEECGKKSNDTGCECDLRAVINRNGRTVTPSGDAYHEEKRINDGKSTQQSQTREEELITVWNDEEDRDSVGSRGIQNQEDRARKEERSLDIKLPRGD